MNIRQPFLFLHPEKLKNEFLMTNISEYYNIIQNLLESACKYDICMTLVSNSDINNTGFSDYEVICAAGAESELPFNNSSDYFNDLKKYLDSTKDFVFGHFGYDLKNQIEDLVSVHNDNIGFPDAYFFVPSNIITYSNKKLHVVKKDKFFDLSSDSISRVKNIINNKTAIINKRITSDVYINTINEIKKQIQRGNIFEMNFCYEYYIDNYTINPVDVFMEINEISPMPFAGLYKYYDKYLLCFSPERFIKKTGNKILSQPIKGTIKRSSNISDDAALKSQLKNSLKERTENIMITDLVRNDLSKSAKQGTVKVDELCKVYPFKQVYQMISTISAIVADNIHPADIIKNAFPMGSMTGAPKVKAMQIAERYEKTKRGLYSGSIGYFTPENDFDFNVVIRSICYNETGKYLNFMVGSAITSQCKAEDELEECELKAGAFFHWIRNSIYAE